MKKLSNIDEHFRTDSPEIEISFGEWEEIKNEIRADERLKTLDGLAGWLLFAYSHRSLQEKGGDVNGKRN